MSGPGGIGGNRPTNNIASYPSTSPNSRLDVNDPELNEHGRFVAEQQAQAKTVALAGGPQRTAQAQPPGKSFTETMGAAFTAMGAAVTNFFKGLGDRIATIEMPSLPRISLRRQEAVQAEAAAPQRPADPFEAAMGGKPVSAKVRADFTAFALVASALGKDTAAIIDHILALPEGNAVAKANDALATRRADQPNLQVMKALRSEEGLSLSHLVSNFVKSGAEQELNLSYNKGLVASIVDINGKLNKLGLKDAVVRQVPNENGPGFSLQVSSPRGAVGGEAIDLLRQMEVQVGILAESVHKEMSTQLNAFGMGGLMQANGQQPEQKLFNAGLAALADGAKAVGNAAASSHAELAQLEQMSTRDFAQALQADPSLARRLPEMALGSEARQAFMTYAVAQPPGTTLQDKVAGFAYQVRDQIIQESLAAGGMIAAPVQAPAALPSVHLDSLAHVLSLSADAVAQGKSMEGLQAFMTNVEHNNENLDFLATGTALLRFENALGHEVPANFAVGKPGAASLSLNFDLPAVRQWAEQFVGDGAPTQVNVSATQATALQQALNSMPHDAASATDAQRSALTTAMADCLGEIQKLVNSDTKPRYESAQTR